MDYAEVQAAFFSPRTGATRPLDWSSPARALRDAMEPVAMVCFWSEPAYDELAARGMDFLSGYAWGRASVLGEAEPAVAAAAFGVFEPGLVVDLVRAGRQACSLADVRAARVAGVTAAMHAVHGTPPDSVAETVRALRSAAEACPVTGRPFFAGWTAQPWPDDPWAQLWQACSTLRELRGDGHLAALVAAGVDGVQANVLTELWVGWDPLLSYTGSRGWSPESMGAAVSALEARGLVADGALTDAGRALREQVESATDATVAPAVDALGDGIGALTEQLAGWAELVVQRGWFPPDPYKRTSG